MTFIATGLLVLQLKEKGCCHWFTHATRAGLDEEQRLRLLRRLPQNGSPLVNENNSRSTATSNNRNFAILFPSMVVSKLAREEEQKKKKITLLLAFSKKFSLLFLIQ